MVVRRAQLGTNPGHPLKENENEQARREEKGGLVVLLLAERARSECAPSMRAMETTPAASPEIGNKLTRVRGAYRKDLQVVLFCLPSQLTYSPASRSLSPNFLFVASGVITVCIFPGLLLKILDALVEHQIILRCSCSQD